MGGIPGEGDWDPPAGITGEPQRIPLVFPLDGTCKQMVLGAIVLNTASMDSRRRGGAKHVKDRRIRECVIGVPERRSEMLSCKKLREKGTLQAVVPTPRGRRALVAPEAEV